MGIGRGSSSSNTKTVYVDVPNPLNPNPLNYNVTDIEIVGGFTIICVTYPNCTNYEGKKIIVFRGDHTIPLIKTKKLDPHFAKDSAIVARFEPTPAGLAMAKMFCIAYTKEINAR